MTLSHLLFLSFLLGAALSYQIATTALDTEGTLYSYVYDLHSNELVVSAERTGIAPISSNYITTDEAELGGRCWLAIGNNLVCVLRSENGTFTPAVNITVETDADDEITLLGGMYKEFGLSDGDMRVILSFVFNNDSTTGYIGRMRLNVMENATTAYLRDFSSNQVPYPLVTPDDLSYFYDNGLEVIFQRGNQLIANSFGYYTIDFNSTSVSEVDQTEFFLRQQGNITTANNQRIGNVTVILSNELVMYLPDGTWRVLNSMLETELISLTVQLIGNAPMTVFPTTPFGTFQPQDNSDSIALDSDLYFLLIIACVMLPAGCFMWTFFKCCCDSEATRHCCAYFWSFPFQPWAWAASCASHSLTTFAVAPIATRRCAKFNLGMKTWGFVYEQVSDMLVALVVFYIFRNSVSGIVFVLVVGIIGFAIRIPIKIMLFFFMRRKHDSAARKSTACHLYLWIPCLVITAFTLVPWATFLYILRDDLQTILLLWAISQGLMLTVEWQLKYIAFVFEGRDLARDAFRNGEADTGPKTCCATSMLFTLTFLSGSMIADSVSPLGDALFDSLSRKCCC